MNAINTSPAQLVSHTLTQIVLLSSRLRVLQPVAALMARLYVAHVFFLAGLTKVRDWDTTLFLFTDEYKVPLLPPVVAAIMGTCAELVLPVLLVLGFCRSPSFHSARSPQPLCSSTFCGALCWLVWPFMALVLGLQIASCPTIRRIDVPTVRQQALRPPNGERARAAGHTPWTA